MKPSTFVLSLAMTATFLGCGDDTAVGPAGDGGVFDDSGTAGTGGGDTGGQGGGGGGQGGGGGGGQGGAGGRMCGGVAGLRCPAGEFCELPTGTCAMPDAAGTCLKNSGLACPAIYAPVCGCDGKTHSNDCIRQGAGVSKARDGECGQPVSLSCPPQLPQSGSACPQESFTCVYGDDPREACLARASCSSNRTWSITAPRCQPIPAAMCPATREQAAGKACTPRDAFCNYAGLICTCTNCMLVGSVLACGTADTWQCGSPHPDPKCPAAKPRLGSSCVNAGQVCHYECGGEGARLCQQGVWFTTQGQGCPVSNRAVKKDIVYLTDESRRRIADELLGIRLATYEYIDPAKAGHRHLGFVIEDLPAASPAVAPNRMLVDLYGYTSMLLAATQTQAKTLARLQAEVADLKRELRKQRRAAAPR